MLKLIYIYMELYRLCFTLRKQQQGKLKVKVTKIMYFLLDREKQVKEYVSLILSFKLIDKIETFLATRTFYGRSLQYS